LPHYELMYILRPELGEAEIEEQMARFAQIAADHGAKVNQPKVWEKRRLAYQIKGAQDGTYVLMTFEAGRDAVAAVDRQLRLAEPVLRHMIVLAETGPRPETHKGEQNVQQSGASGQDVQ